MLILFLFCVASYLIILPALLNVTRTALDTVYESVAESPESAQVGAALPVQKTAYLTFDDGPSRVTPQVLDLLKSEGIHATFFVTYHEYSRYDEMLRRIVAEGHTLGNHTYSHVYDKIYASPESFLAEVAQMREKIYEITGIDTTLFRYPGGSIAARNFSKGSSPDIFETMERAGYFYFDWNADGGDQIAPFPSGKEVAQRILATTKNLNNTVVLLHDTGLSQNTLEALPIVIEGLREQGFSFGTLSEDAVKVQFKK